MLFVCVNYSSKTLLSSATVGIKTVRGVSTMGIHAGTMNVDDRHTLRFKELRSITLIVTHWVPDQAPESHVTVRFHPFRPITSLAFHSPISPYLIVLILSIRPLLPWKHTNHVILICLTSPRWTQNLPNFGLYERFSIWIRQPSSLRFYR